MVGDSRSSVAPAPEHHVLSFPLPAPSPPPCCLTRARASPTHHYLTASLPHTCSCCPCPRSRSSLSTTTPSDARFRHPSHPGACSVSDRVSRCETRGAFAFSASYWWSNNRCACVFAVCGTLGPRVRQGRLGCVGRALPRGRPPNHPRTPSGVRGREVLCAGCCWSQGAWSLVSTRTQLGMCALG